MMRALKVAGIVIGSLVVMLVVAAGVLYVLGGMRFQPPDALPAETVAVSADSAGLAYGEHLARTHGCTECHGDRLQGQVMVDAPPFLVVASNLTAGAGGVAPMLDALGWERAIRHGVGYDGRALGIMPAESYTFMSDDEVAALIGWMQTVPAVDNELPSTVVRPLGRIIAGTGGIEPTSAMIDHTRAHPATAPPLAATVEYGEHRARTLCMVCHGENLGGMQPPNPDSPPAPSLHPVASWTLEQFATAMRTGQTPARQLDNAFMPWQAFANFADAEIAALHMYLGSIAN